LQQLAPVRLEDGRAGSSGKRGIAEAAILFMANLQM
jgi:hypothetical protein